MNNPNTKEHKDIERIKKKDAFIMAFSCVDDVFDRVGIDRIPLGRNKR